MKDMDGAREVHFEARGGRVYMWGRGFSYEFDAGVFAHQVGRLIAPAAPANAERAPRLGGALRPQPASGIRSSVRLSVSPSRST